MSISIPTPRIAHFTEDDYEHIYEPAEDSFILLDALEQDAGELRDRKPALCVEIGLGSGVVSTFLATLLGPLKSLILGTDINPYACKAALRTASENDVQLDAIRGYLLNTLKPAWGKVDVLVFNPPYVPTDHTELTSTQAAGSIGGAWAGGGDGMGLTARLLPSISDILALEGRFYLVAVEPNRPLEIVKYLKSLGLSTEVVIKRRAGRELLSVIRAIKTPDA